MEIAMQNIKAVVEKYRELILAAERYIWKNPETGYREVKTTAYLAERFEELGYNLTRAVGITGFFTTIDTGKEGAHILIMGELDSVICPSHPDADQNSGAVHACGHNAQCAALLGIAAALTEPEIIKPLSGKITLAAVPAEELLEIEYRSRLRKEGKIKYFGGKPEFLYRGYFDGVDVGFMVHTTTGKGFAFTEGSVGCITKKIIYKGKAAHAGAFPWLGNNALYAATAGINAANAVRETFRDEDIIRSHPIIVHGGDMVNAIPDRVIIESYTRGKSFDAIVEANQRINQAFIGAAISLGTNIEIIDMPGYAPHVNDKELTALAKQALSLVLPDEEVENLSITSGSTDNGDLSSIMPLIQPYCAGAVGLGHGANYFIADPEHATVNSAVFQLALLRLLSENGGERAKKIKENYKPRFKSKEDFFAYIDAINSSGDRIEYSDEGIAKIKI